MVYDPSTAAGQVRLLINDTGAAPVFTDGEIDAFLTLGGGTALGQVMRAAAQALDTLASNEALLSKVIRTQDLATDGAKVGAELRARAVTLREQADLADDSAEPDAAFGIVDYDPWNGLLHGELAELPWTWP